MKSVRNRAAALAYVCLAFGAASQALGGQAASASDVVLDPSLAPARASGAPVGDAFDPGEAGFTLRVKDWAIRYRFMAVIALPGETLRIEVAGAGAVAGVYRLRFGAGSGVIDSAPARWTWTAPEEVGIYAVRAERADASSFIHLNVLVARPSSDIVDGLMNGYPIGSYRSRPYRGLAPYLPPNGFAEVFAADEEIRASPHFSIGQFVCKQPGTPRYLLLSTDLLLKLEAVLEATNRAGHATQTFFVMSGFRTPVYNRAIGNRTPYSRHLWGDAADFYIDTDGDGIIDDLNGDGRSDIEDAQVLARIIDDVEATAPPGVIPGGMATYRASRLHGPFVHIDSRGYRARW